MRFSFLIIFGVLTLNSSVLGQNTLPVPNQPDRLMSDVRADGLRGKVKQVVVESEYLQSHLENLKKRFGTVMEGKRSVSSITEYDENGNRTKRESYSSGRIFSKVFYSFLDGIRISKEESVTYGDEIMAPPTVFSTEQRTKPKDNRFTYKFLYKYDGQGNRVEEIWQMNTGDVWIKDTIVFDKNNRIIEKTRRHRGEEKIASTVKFFYDDNGNLKQEVYIDSFGEESEKHYSYEFDSQGNWIKHTVSKQTTYNPKGVFEPFLVTYQKITYF